MIFEWILAFLVSAMVLWGVFGVIPNRFIKEYSEDFLDRDRIFIRWTGIVLFIVFLFAIGALYIIWMDGEYGSNSMAFEGMGGAIYFLLGILLSFSFSLMLSLGVQESLSVKRVNSKRKGDS